MALLSWRALPATKKRIHDDADGCVVADRETGDFETFRRWEVVADEISLEAKGHTLSDAQKQDPDVEIDYLEESKRCRSISADCASGQAGDSPKIRDAERDQIFNDFPSARSISLPARSSAWSLRKCHRLGGRGDRGRAAAGSDDSA